MAKRPPRKLRSKPGPKFKIDSKEDWELFDDLCALHCTITEIASVFHCDKDTVSDAVKRVHGVEFSAHWEKKAALGKMSLRRMQLKSAREGNVTMQIWLGKQKLKQGNDGPVVDKPPVTSGNLSDVELLRTVADLIERQRNSPIIPDMESDKT